MVMKKSKENLSASGIRTHDLRIASPALYRLSHGRLYISAGIPKHPFNARLVRGYETLA